MNEFWILLATYAGGDGVVSERMAIGPFETQDTCEKATVLMLVSDTDSEPHAFVMRCVPNTALTVVPKMLPPKSDTPEGKPNEAEGKNPARDGHLDT